MANLKATCRKAGKKYKYEVTLDGKLIGKRTSDTRYGYAVVVHVQHPRFNPETRQYVGPAEYQVKRFSQDLRRARNGAEFFGYLGPATLVEVIHAEVPAHV